MILIRKIQVTRSLMWIVRGVSWISLFFGVVMASCLADGLKPIPELDSLNRAFDAALTTAQEPLVTLKDQYRDALEKQKTSFQNAGDLDGVIAIDAELVRFRACDDGDEKIQNGVLKKLHQIYVHNKSDRAEKVAKNIAAPVNAHAKSLAELELKLTKSGATAEALYVREVKDRFKENWKTQIAQLTPDPPIRAGEVREFEIKPGVKFKMCWIPAGEFTMGSEVVMDATPHAVKITQGFWLGQTEVTQGQWEAVMGNNPSYFKGDKKLPVDSVSWNDICGNEERTGGFLGKLNDLQPTGGRFDLPTEAQWEYACRAGKSGDSGDLDSIAWNTGNSSGKTHPVGQKKANAWGLQDMMGNVWEWCVDWKVDYTKGAAVDPIGPSSGSNRVSRGGSWVSNVDYCRVAFRYSAYNGSGTSYDFGFRVARSSAPQ